MTINSNSTNSIPPSCQPSVLIPPVNSSSSMSPEIRPASRGGGGGNGGGAVVNSGGGGLCGNLTPSSKCTTVHAPTSSGLSSPNMLSEPVAGPSGMGPVQSMPLVCYPIYIHLFQDFY